MIGQPSSFETQRPQALSSGLRRWYSTQRSTQRAFTLVELLVVIAIIALLVGLLIPAVQAARASARKVQCANNFKQVALAVLQHASNTDELPARHDPRFREGYLYVKGWRFTILPYLEEQAIYDLFVDPENYSLELVHSSAVAFGPSPVETVSTSPCVSPPFLCPETPGTPRLYSLATVVSSNDGSLLYDAFATQQTAPIRWIHDERSRGSPRRSEPGAWAGTSLPFRLASERDARDREVHNGASLRWIIDGLSKTILVIEQAGDPDLYVGDEIVRYHSLSHTLLWPGNGQYKPEPTLKRISRS